MSQVKLPYQFADYDTRQVLGFFISKGLLIAPGIDPAPTAKLRIETVVDIGLKVEPRVLEVLPAAILHFPRSFINLDKMPDKLKMVVEAIRKDQKSGPTLGGIKYQAMKRWANKKLKDGRAVPEEHRRIMRSYRFSRAALSRLKQRSKELGRTETEILEELILGD